MAHRFSHDEHKHPFHDSPGCVGVTQGVKSHLFSAISDVVIESESINSGLEHFTQPFNLSFFAVLEQGLFGISDWE